MPNIVIFVISDEKKIGKKSEKNQNDVVMLLICLHGLCECPNMVIDVNIARKSGKIKIKKEQT